MNFIEKTIITLKNYFIGKTMASAVVGFISYAVLSYFDVRYAFLISMIVFFTNYVPTVGPIVGGVASGIVVLFQEPIWSLYLIIFLIVLQQLDMFILTPIFLGKQTGLSPVVVLVSIIVGTMVFGIIGTIFAVPVAAVMKVLFVKDTKDDIYKSKKKD